MLLDVDGTIVDSAGVVIRSFQRTAEDLGLPPLPDDDYRPFVGPPLFTSFERLGLRGDELGRAVEHYRSVYSGLYLEPDPYPGIAELLADLDAAGLALATATSKQLHMARGQLEHLDLARHFDAIAGATPDPACTKATVIRDALSQLTALGRDVSRPVLVGDRFWDVEGGAEAGVPVIGAGWGYGEPGELDGAWALAPDVASLRALLLGAETA